MSDSKSVDMKDNKDPDSSENESPEEMQEDEANAETSCILIDDSPKTVKIETERITQLLRIAELTELKGDAPSETKSSSLYKFKLLQASDFADVSKPETSEATCSDNQNKITQAAVEQALNTVIVDEDTGSPKLLYELQNINWEDVFETESEYINYNVDYPCSPISPIESPIETANITPEPRFINEEQLRFYNLIPRTPRKTVTFYDPVGVSVEHNVKLEHNYCQEKMEVDNDPSEKESSNDEENMSIPSTSRGDTEEDSSPNSNEFGPDDHTTNLLMRVSESLAEYQENKLMYERKEKWARRIVKRHFYMTLEEFFDILADTDDIKEGIDRFENFLIGLDKPRPTYIPSRREKFLCDMRRFKKLMGLPIDETQEILKTSEEIETNSEQIIPQYPSIAMHSATGKHTIRHFRSGYHSV